LFIVFSEKLGIIMSLESKSAVFEYLMKACSNHKPKKNCDRQEIPLRKNDIVIILVIDDGNGWMKGKKQSTCEIGWFPKNCVREIPVFEEPMFSLSSTSFLL
jgi:hypothetical protein